MLTIIKNNKFDNFFDKVAIIDVLLYLFCMQMRESYYFDFAIIASCIKQIIRASFILIALKDGYDFLRGKFSIYEIIAYVVLGVLFLNIYIRFHQGMFLFTLLCIISLKGINYKIIAKYIFMTLLLAFIIITLSSVLHIIKQHTTTNYRYGQSRLRYHLGYCHYNCPLNYYMAIVSMYIIYNKSITKIQYVILLVVNVFIFILTDTKNAFLCINIMLLLNFIFKKFYKEKPCNLFMKLTIVSYPLAVVLIIILALLYRTENFIIKVLNSLSTGRIALISKGFTKWGFSLFGQRFSYFATEYDYIDSGYMHVLLNYGLITLIVLIAFYMILSFKSYIAKNIGLSIVLFTYAFHCMFDRNLILLFYAPFVLLYYCIDYDKKSI